MTHVPDLAASAADGRAFAERIQLLGDRLGRALLMPPPGFLPSQLPSLRTFLAALPPDFALAVEFRHPSFFRKRTLIPAAFDLLAELGHASVVTDTAGRRDVSHASFPTPVAFVRFLGNDLHPTDFTRLDAWAARFDSWLKAGLSEALFFLHEPDNVHSPEASNAFLERLNRVAGTSLAPFVPPKVPKQLSLL